MYYIFCSGKSVGEKLFYVHVLFIHRKVIIRNNMIYDDLCPWIVIKNKLVFIITVKSTRNEPNLSLYLNNNKKKLCRESSVIILNSIQHATRYTRIPIQYVYQLVAVLVRFCL